MERLPVGVRQLDVGRGRARERVAAGLRAERPEAVVSVADQRRADRLCDGGEIDPVISAHERDAAMLATKTFGTDVPPSDARELVSSDDRGTEEHRRSLARRSRSE